MKMKQINGKMLLPLLDTYGDLETINCFSEEAMFNGWLEAEVALAKAQGEENIIPKEAAKKIEASAKYELLDLNGFWEETKNVGYPIVPLVKRLSAVSGEYGGYVHWGATTQDIMDTGLVIQLRNAIKRLEQLLIECGSACATLIEKYASTPQAGRTHGQQAVPITFGMKVSVWLSELRRHVERLQEVKSRLLVGQLFGAAGTLATLGTKSTKVRTRFCELLELQEPEGPWHVARDTVVEFANLQSMISGTLQKVAKEIADLARTEINEVQEMKGQLRGASSTMPQKENPISSETIIGLTTINMSLVSGFYQTMTPVHERATGEWQAEWDMIPLVSVGTAGALSLMGETLKNLSVNEEVMKQNLEMDNGLIMAESVMMKLTEKMGKQKAHEKMYEICRVADKENQKLKNVLENDATIIQTLKVDDVKSSINPMDYLGEAAPLSNRAILNWEETLNNYGIKK
ncbi:class-II fumarase/aspartase family protein [Lentibacillus amyloliquefaciens]|uniref:Adenylosuccinate lyase C-terminal domain-containing protein n=1 Tax=Lentibacillus amyloliquefaciens TaxID=1472767 RepID=A0A0U4FIJ3_9BACI|nr:adenylosuccinate lyase family protein [Lentibacillus amyloliquefaciens]ALX47572.1 hypothetical protein AOX59_02505 [Lentibacillus amyloliquefaciens]